MPSAISGTVAAGRLPGPPWLVAERSAGGAFRELFRRTYQL